MAVHLDEHTYQLIDVCGSTCRAVAVGWAIRRKVRR